MEYTPSKLLSGEPELLRAHGFTRWLDRDLAQAAVEFNRILGLIPIYTEFSPIHQVRYLFWLPPAGAVFEVRSGRAQEQFEAFDQANRDRSMPLLSLHVNEQDFYSAVWISAPHFEIARTFLSIYGISPAEPLDD